MFLPNTNSFLLIRRPIVEPSFTTPEARRGAFLPNTNSFLLIRRPIIDPVRGKTSLEEGSSADRVPRSGDTHTPGNSVFQAGRTSNGIEQFKVSDQGKRTFLKVASIAGASAIASQILSPQKASAFIMGSSPTTGVIGVKDSDNVRINPATEETVSTLATEATVSTLLKPSDLTFDAGNLQVKVTSLPAAGSSSFSDSGDVDRKGLVDATSRRVQVDVVTSALPSSASTEATLQTISTENTLETISFGGVQFALRLATDGDIDYVGEAVVGSGGEGDSVWRIKKIDSSSGIVIKWADGDAGLNNTWTGYAGHTYS